MGQMQFRVLFWLVTVEFQVYQIYCNKPYMRLRNAISHFMDCDGKYAYKCAECCGKYVLEIR